MSKRDWINLLFNIRWRLKLDPEIFNSSISNFTKFFIYFQKYKLITFLKVKKDGLKLAD